MKRVIWRTISSRPALSARKWAGLTWNSDLWGRCFIKAFLFSLRPVLAWVGYVSFGSVCC
jgi:hypothetical protein